jgi:hypothetical protein
MIVYVKPNVPPSQKPVLVIYHQRFKESLFRDRIVTSTKFGTTELLLSYGKGELLCGFNTPKECYNFIRSHSHIVFVLGTYANLDMVLDRFEQNNIHPTNIINVCFNVDMNLYTAPNSRVTFVEDGQRDMIKQLKYKNNFGITQLSSYINNTIIQFEPTIWLSSFYDDIPLFQSLFDRDNLSFKDSPYRLGIQIHRQSDERLLLASTLLGDGYIPNSIFISLSHPDQEGIIDMFSAPAYGLLLYHKEKYIKGIDTPNSSHTYEEKQSILQRYWIQAYQLFTMSKIEIVMETFNVLTELSDWQGMFTEKILKPLLAAKPMLISDPFTFNLFKGWGFEVDEQLYGNTLLNVYNEYMSGTYDYMTVFVSRLQEIDSLSETEFNYLYSNSLKIAMRNRQKIKEWRWWYKDIDRFFVK